MARRRSTLLDAERAERQIDLAERPSRAREHRDRETIVRLEAGETVSQRCGSLGVDRVPEVGTVDGDGEDRPIDLGSDGSRAPLARGRLP